MSTCSIVYFNAVVRSDFLVLLPVHLCGYLKHFRKDHVELRLNLSGATATNKQCNGLQGIFLTANINI